MLQWIRKEVVLTICLRHFTSEWTSIDDATHSLNDGCFSMILVLQVVSITRSRTKKWTYGVLSKCIRHLSIITANLDPNFAKITKDVDQGSFEVLVRLFITQTVRLLDAFVWR